MPDTMTGELYAVVYAMCVKTCHLFAYDGLDCFALPCDVMYKIWSINLYIYIYDIWASPECNITSESTYDTIEQLRAKAQEFCIG